MRTIYARVRASFPLQLVGFQDERLLSAFSLYSTIPTACTVSLLHLLSNVYFLSPFFLVVHPSCFLSPDVDRYRDFLLRRSAYNRAEAIIVVECDRLSLLSFGWRARPMEEGTSRSIGITSRWCFFFALLFVFRIRRPFIVELVWQLDRYKTVWITYRGWIALERMRDLREMIT